MSDDKMMIQIKGLTKAYGEKKAVDNLTLGIKRGEIFGLLGPNGAGKTTTTLMLLGLTEPTAGTAFIDGKNCTRDPISVKRIVGYLPDSVGFYMDMTGRENLRFTGRLNGLGGKELEERIQALLEKVGMTAAADQKTATYSRGMKQRLGVADVLIKDPRVIIMDEPTLGLDPEGIRDLMSLIRRLAEEDGRTILISSHQLYQVQQVCDRVGIFVAGKLVACGRIEELASELQQEGHCVLEVSAIPDDSGFPQLLEKLGNVDQVEHNGEYYVVYSRMDLRRELVRKALQGGYTIAHLRQRGSDLDEIYRRYFEKGEKEHAQFDQKKSGRFLSFRKNQG